MREMLCRCGGESRQGGTQVTGLCLLNRYKTGVERKVMLLEKKQEVKQNTGKKRQNAHSMKLQRQEDEIIVITRQYR